MKYLNFFKKHGIKQLINGRTRPNRKGGTCIDWISTNSDFVRSYGVLDVLISDHLPVYCIRKKLREKHESVYRTVRDFSNYNADNFSTLNRSLNWDVFNNMDDVETVWNYLYKNVRDILSVICPFRSLRQRAKVTPWLNVDIYRAMRKRDKYISLFKITGNQYYLCLARRSRNCVNQMISRAKGQYITAKLRENIVNPKKFWRVINGIINPAKGSAVEMHFYDKTTGQYVEQGKEADFLNDYFLNIVNNLNIIPTDDMCLDIYNIPNRFCFLDNMPTVDEVVRLIKDIDVNKSSCVDGISTRFCKDAMLSIPLMICNLFRKSLETGIIPTSWTKGTITVIFYG